MPLLKQGRVIDDRWHHLADGDPLPAQGPLLVPLARWRAERDALLAHPDELGVAVPNTEPAETLAADLAHFALIALNFPKFTDGRAYSQARLLRERLGFPGELRATGQVLPDQLLFLHRCGFDAFELAKDEPAAVFHTALAAFSAFYQPAGDGGTPIAALRRHVSTPAPARGARA
jgi:uncharacterized protein (DUF934 family)